MFNPLKGPIHETEGVVVGFLGRTKPIQNPREERGESAEREGAGGFSTMVARHFRGSGGSPRERELL